LKILNHEDVFFHLDKNIILISLEIHEYNEFTMIE